MYTKRYTPVSVAGAVPKTKKRLKKGEENEIRTYQHTPEVV